MERESFIPNELTGQSINPTLESGGNIMTDAPGAPTEGPPRPSPITPEQVQQGLNRWIAYWQETGGAITPDALSSARLAAELGQLPPAAQAERVGGQERPVRAQRTRREAGRQNIDDQAEDAAENERSVILEGVRDQEGTRRFFEEMTSVLTNPIITQELRKDAPDFSIPEAPSNGESEERRLKREAILKLKTFISGLDPGGSELPLFTRFVTSPDEDWERVRQQHNIEISTPARRLLFEWALENIIGLPEKGSHEANYREGVGDLNIQGNLTKFRNMSWNHFDPEFATYIGDLIKFREIAHDLRLNLTQGENYKKFIGEGIKAHGLDFMLNGLAGVSEVVSLLETFSALKASQRREWFNKGDIDDIRRQAKEVMTALQRTGQLKRNGRPLTDWEVERALAIGDTFFAGVQRYAVYSAIGSLPPGTAQRIGSLPYEYIVRNLAQFKVTAVRFFNEGGPGEYLRRLRERLKEGKGLVANDKSLFGISDDAWAYNGLGAYDIESHAWRMHLMHFGDMRVNIDRSETLLQFFTRKLIEHGGNLDKALGLEPGSPEEQKKFAEEVQDAILGQRLYLSSLIKHGFWDGMDKKKGEVEGSREKILRKLWQKVAMFDPMGIVSLSPAVLNELSTGERQIWERLQGKLGIASVVRLNLETAGDVERPGIPRNSGYWRNGERVDKTSAELRAEKEAFLAALNGTNDAYKYQIIDRYFDDEKYGNGLKPEEVAVIKKVIDAGISSTDGASYLMKVKFPFAFLINDAPHTAWDLTGQAEGGLGSENVFRILLTDQANLVAGYNEMNTMVENPTHGAIEHLAKAVESIGVVIGRYTAQERIEPFILAYLDMAAERPTAWAFGGVVDFFNKLPVFNKAMPWIGNSEFEKYWRSSGLSFDEEDRAAFLESLARLEAISTDVSKGITTSQLAKLKRETKSWGFWTNWKWLKIFTFIFGAEVALQLVKTLVPKELWESAGVK